VVRLPLEEVEQSSRAQFAAMPVGLIGYGHEQHKPWLQAAFPVTI
jgi:hypothetical protein